MMNKLSGFILVIQVLYCSCQATSLTPVDPEVIEGNNLTFVCKVPGTVDFVYWNVNNATHPQSKTTTFMRVNNGSCVISPNTSKLLNTAKYSYTCTSQIYQLTVKNVQRSQHNYRWSCFPNNKTSGPNSTIKVRGPVKYVKLEPAQTPKKVEEGSAIVLTCNTSGARPKATVTWYKIESGKTSRISQNITSNTTDDDFSVTTSILTFVPTRQQQGVKIFCNATNNRSIPDIKSKHEVEMNVLFRPTSADTVEENKRSEIDASFTFTFNADANPKPTFTWKIWDTDKKQWNKLTDSGDIVIKSSDLQSNLTINVIQKYFTRYKLEIENDVGNMTQFYELLPYENPETPAGFHHVEDLTTATSIHLEWKPGLNGGSSQTFHIKYKESTIKTWNYIKISDAGETVMRYTLTGLTPKTQYDIIIYASNLKGKSAETYVRTVRTKEEPASLGPLIGGIVGGIAVLVIFIIVGIIIWRRYPICKEKKENKTSTRRSAAVSRSSESDGDEMIENQLYEKSDPMYALPIKSKDQIGARDADDKRNAKENGGYIYAEVDKKKKIQPKQKRQTQIDGDIYAEVDKKKKKQSNEKRQKGKVNENVEGTYENSNIVTNEGQKNKRVNQDGLEYIDLVFNDKRPGEKIIKTISGDESVPYDAVDFTKKADPLP